MNKRWVPFFFMAGISIAGLGGITYTAIVISPHVSDLQSVGLTAVFSLVLSPMFYLLSKTYKLTRSKKTPKE